MCTKGVKLKVMRCTCPEGGALLSLGLWRTLYYKAHQSNTLIAKVFQEKLRDAVEDVNAGGGSLMPWPRRRKSELGVFLGVHQFLG